MAERVVGAYLFLVGGTDVEAGHHDGGAWHQVELGVGCPIVTGPVETQTAQHISMELKRWLPTRHTFRPTSSYV